MKWTELQEMKALLIYKIVKAKRSEIIKREINKDNIFSEDNFNTVDLKLKNISYIDSNGGDGLGGYSNQCKDVFNEHKDKSIEELEALIKLTS